MKRFPHPVAIEVSQSRPSPSLSCHYHGIIKQLSTHYNQVSTCTGSTETHGGLDHHSELTYYLHLEWSEPTLPATWGPDVDENR